MMNINPETKKRLKKRFILIGATALIFGLIAFDRVNRYYANQAERDTDEHFEHTMNSADSTMISIDDRLSYLYEREDIDQGEIDSLRHLLKTEDSLNQEEQRTLSDKIKILEYRRLEYTDEIIELTSTTEDSIIINTIVINVYDTMYVDTTVYNYTYVDSTVFTTDTVIKVDTIVIEDEKEIKKILRKYHK